MSYARKGRLNERRWHIGSRILEMLQIAVLEPKGTMANTGFQSDTS